MWVLPASVGTVARALTSSGDKGVKIGEGTFANVYRGELCLPDAAAMVLTYL